ncbi:MAG TPA: periplasmic heavy metal sensor [Polyangiaceae bacterium]|nr:periplasmic heavy metal sensor [Polyangiaceae bacterium]
MNRAKMLPFALVVSVVINVFLIGFVAARVARRHEDRRFDGFGADRAAGPARGMWNRHGVLLRPRRDALEAARRGVRDALLADPFQPEAFEMTLAKLRAETGDAQTVLHRALVEEARSASTDERRRLANSKWFLGFEGRGVPRGR